MCENGEVLATIEDDVDSWVVWEVIGGEIGYTRTWEDALAEVLEFIGIPDIEVEKDADISDEEDWEEFKKTH